MKRAQAKKKTAAPEVPQRVESASPVEEEAAVFLLAEVVALSAALSVLLAPKELPTAPLAYPPEETGV